MKQTPEERIGFLENEQTYLKTRITRLKNNKKDPREPDLIARYLKVAEENYKKNEDELKQLKATNKK